MRIRLLSTLALLVSLVAWTSSASALDLTDRMLEVGGKLNVSASQKLAKKLIELDAQAEAPIYLMVTATEGSAQGVMVLADTIRSMKSPVVGVVVTQVHGAGAAVALMTDRVLMYRSAGLVFTEIEYEGVKKPKPKKDEPPAEGAAPKKAEEPSPEEKLLQKVRTDYLARFWGTIAERVKMQGPALTKRIDEGGFAMTADEAVKKKVAFAVVERITFTALPQVKREVKSTTQTKQTKVVPTDKDGKPGT